LFLIIAYNLFIFSNLQRSQIYAKSPCFAISIAIFAQKNLLQKNILSVESRKSKDRYAQREKQIRELGINGKSGREIFDFTLFICTCQKKVVNLQPN